MVTEEKLDQCKHSLKNAKDCQQNPVQSHCNFVSDFQLTGVLSVLQFYFVYSNFSKCAYLHSSPSSHHILKLALYLCEKESTAVAQFISEAASKQIMFRQHKQYEHSELMDGSHAEWGKERRCTITSYYLKWQAYFWNLSLNIFR